MTNLNDTLSKINALASDLDFRAMVVKLAVENKIPADVWNNDKKLQCAVYMKFASDVILSK